MTETALTRSVVPGLLVPGLNTVVGTYYEVINSFVWGLMRGIANGKQFLRYQPRKGRVLSFSAYCLKQEDGIVTQCIRSVDDLEYYIPQFLYSQDLDLVVIDGTIPGLYLNQTRNVLRGLGLQFSIPIVLIHQDGFLGKDYEGTEDSLITLHFKEGSDTGEVFVVGDDVDSCSFSVNKRWECSNV